MSAATPSPQAFPTTTASLRDGGTGAMAYSEAVGVYLAFAVDKVADSRLNACTLGCDRTQKCEIRFGDKRSP